MVLFLFPTFQIPWERRGKIYEKDNFGQRKKSKKWLVS